MHKSHKKVPVCLRACLAD